MSTKFAIGGARARVASALGMGITAALPLFALAAGTDSSGALEEIVVTAQKRAQDIQDVGLSVAAFGAETLRDRGITTTEELGSATPGLIVNDYGNPVITVFTLRGVQEFDFGDHQESPIAVFVDGSYVPYLSAVGMDLFDLERVEVLRGPQGTLFGRNATGGAIQLVSAKPTEELSGYGQVDAGNFNARRVEAAISGPIADGWLGRLSVLKDEHDGYYKNLIGADPGNADNLSWRGQLFRRLSDAGDLTLAVRGSHDDTSSSPYQSAAAYPDPATGLLLSGAGNPAAFASFCASFFGAPVGPHPTDCLSGDANTGNPFTIHNNRVGSFTRDYVGASATLNWDFGAAKLTSITSYGHLKKNYGGEDSDGTSLDVLTFGQTVKATDVSEEIRLAGKSARNDWIIGVYGLHIDGNYGTDVGFFMFDPSLTAFLGNAYGLRTQTWAVFGQTEFTIAPQWTVTAGLRWTEDDKSFHMVTPCVGPGCDPFGFTNPAFVQGTGYNSSVPGARTTRDSGNWDGKLQLNWKPSEDLLGYAGITRGTKAGGFNGGATAFYTVAQEIFNDEVLTDYEIGVKSRLAGGRVHVNASAFYYDYRNMQVFNQMGPSTVTFNRDGTVRGGEVDLQARIVEGLDFQLGLALLHTRIDPIANLNILTGTLVESSEELPNSPHVTVNAHLTKTWLFGPARIALEADGKWVGARKLNLIDNPATNETAYSTLDVRASYGPANGRWEVALYSQNLTNETYRIVGTPFVSTNGGVIEIFGPPRTFGGSFRIRF
jgi:iron complex outermembrane receptor protein